MKDKSSLLISNIPALQVLPGLVGSIGLNEAIVLQQVHYWVRLNSRRHKNYRNGYFWTWNTYETWQADNFPFWSVATIKRIFRRLERKGLLICDRLDKNPWNRTKWSRVDYDALQTVTGFNYLVCDPPEGIQDEK